MDQTTNNISTHTIQISNKSKSIRHQVLIVFFSEKVLIDIKYHLTVGTPNYLSMSNVNYITG